MYASIKHNILLDALPFERPTTLWSLSGEEFSRLFANDKQDVVSWREFVELFDAGFVSPKMPFPEVMLLVDTKSRFVVEAHFRALPSVFLPLSHCPQNFRPITT